MAFLSSNNEMPSALQGMASLVTAGSIKYDTSMEQVVSVTLTGVGRTKISRVRAVKDGLLVADGWNPVLDDVPDASYKHQLQVLRPDSRHWRTSPIEEPCQRLMRFAPGMSLLHFCRVPDTELSCGGRQALRFLADDSIAEHNMRRALMRRIVSKSVELQLCDLSGACSTQALLDLGPQESGAA